MTSFVEKAVMIVEDKSTKNLSKIQKALRSLNKQAAMTQKAFKTVKFDGISNADVARMRRTGEAMNKMALSGKKLQAVGAIKTRVTVTGSNVRKHTNELNALAAAQKKIRPTVATRFQSTGTVPAIPAPAIRPGVQRGPMNFNGGVIGQSMGNAFLTSVKYRLAASIQDAIIAGIRNGMTDLDVGDTRLSLQKLSDDEKSTVKAQSTLIASQGTGVLSSGAATKLIGEVIPVVRGDIGLAGEMVAVLDSIIALQVSQGESLAHATESAINLAKVAEQTGRLTDSQGNFDEAGFTNFATLITGAMAQGGQEITAQLVRGVTKSLRTAKLTLDDRGLLAAIGVAEEVGTTAGVGINQLIKQLSGERVKKKQLQNQIALGLATEGQEVKIGTEGGKDVMRRTSGGAVDEAMLRQDIVSWIAKNVIPAMERQGLDPNNAVEAAQFAGSVTSDRTATDALTQMIIRNNELQTWIDQALKLQQTPDQLDAINDKSSLVAFASAQAQLTSLLGETANSFEGVLIPALDGAASAARILSQFVSGPDGEGSPARAAAALATGAAGTTALALGGKKVLDMLTGIPANTTALTANTAAINRLTGATALGGNGTGKGNKGGRAGKAGKLLSAGIGARGVGAAGLAATGVRFAAGPVGTAYLVDQVVFDGAGSKALYDATIGEFINSANKARDQNKAQRDAMRPKDHVNEMSAEIATLTSEILARKQALPDAMEGSDPMLATMQADRASLQVEMQALQASLGQGAQEMAAVFEGGAMSLQQVGPTITAASAAAGANLANPIVAAASQGGEILAASIRSAAASVRVNVNQAQPAPDAGNMDLAN